MNVEPSSALPGRVMSLHLHPTDPGATLQTVEEIEVVEQKGIAGEPRYFGRVYRENGHPHKRQVTLIEREQLQQHAGALGLQAIPPGAVRSNIETFGINLVELVGRQVEIGSAVLFLSSPRDPCEKMDAICQGLKQLMKDQRQGVLAQVVRSGKIRVGDSIVVRSAVAIR